MIDQLVDVLAECLERLCRRFVKTEIDEVFPKLRADEEFSGKIDGGATRLLKVGFGGLHPVEQHPVAHGVGEGEVIVVLRGDLGKPSNHAEKLVFDGSTHVGCSDGQVRCMRSADGWFSMGEIHRDLA